MGISLQPKHLRRYGALARMLVKYGRSDLVRNAGLDQALSEEEDGVVPVDGAAAEAAGELADDLERLGPTYIKLGQLLSTRSDFLPPAYMEALQRLQDKIEPFPFAQVEEIVESELGVRLSKAFAEFDPEPIAAASLGQVHRALLRNGRCVAVKVQRPGIREQIADDVEALADIADFVDKHTDAGERVQFSGMLDEFRRSMVRELDYLKEAQHLMILRRNLAEFDLLIVPEPVEDYTTSRVLTMDYISGRKITDLSPLARMEMNGEALGEQLFKAYLKQILVDGIFHADPHPGNVFLTYDGRLALIDVGMIGRIAPVMQQNLLKLLLAVSEGKGESAAEIATDMGTITDAFDRDTYTREVSQLVAQHQSTTMAQLDTGRVVLEITRTAAQNGLRLPPELTLLGKTLLNLYLVSRILAPDFDPNDAVRRHASDLMRQRLNKLLSPGNVVSTVMELNDFVQHLPGRMNRVFEKVVNDQLTLKVNAFDEVKLMEGMQKIANRITVGLIIAACTIGAALMMRVPSSLTVLGYPALAMLLFLVAFISGLLLVYSILFGDEHKQ